MVCVEGMKCWSPSHNLLITLGSKVHMLASTVSSKLLRSMAEVEGFKFQVRVHVIWCKVM